MSESWALLVVEFKSYVWVLADTDSSCCILSQHAKFQLKSVKIIFFRPTDIYPVEMNINTRSSLLPRTWMKIYQNTRILNTLFRKSEKEDTRNFGNDLIKKSFQPRQRRFLDLPSPLHHPNQHQQQFELELPRSNAYDFSFSGIRISTHLLCNICWPISNPFSWWLLQSSPNIAVNLQIKMV